MKYKGGHSLFIPLEHHQGCLANQALKEQTAKRVVGYFDYAGAVLDSYWIPLAGSDEAVPAFCGGHHCLGEGVPEPEQVRRRGRLRQLQLRIRR